MTAYGFWEVDWDESDDEYWRIQDLAECVSCGIKPEALFWDSKCEDCTEVISKFGGGRTYNYEWFQDSPKGCAVCGRKE